MVWIFLATGIIIGSMLNFFIYRIPREIKLYRKLPTCGYCERIKKWYEYIPILGFFLNHRCPLCHKKKNIRELLIPIVNAIMYVVFYFVYKDIIYFAIISSLLVSVLITVAVIDYDFYIIPDRMHIFILGLGIAASIFEFLDYGSGLDIDIIARVIGFFAGGLLLYLTGLLVSKKLNKEALGGGDVKLMAVMGFFLGWKLILLSIFFGSIIAMIQMPFTKRRSEEGGIAFGPFLVIGIIIALLVGNIIFNWYVGLFS